MTSLHLLNLTISATDIARALKSLAREYPDGRYGTYGSRRYELRWMGRNFPPKLVIVRASEISTGRTVGHLDFSGGEAPGQANAFLRRFANELGFTIERKRRATSDSKQPARDRTRSFLLTWNPKKYVWKTLTRDYEKFLRTGTLELKWSSGRRKSIRTGDRVFLMRLGGFAPTGIFLSGRVTEPPREGAPLHRAAKSSSERTNYVRFNVEKFSFPEADHGFECDVLNHSELKEIAERASRTFSWTPQGSGVKIPEDIVELLDQAWGIFATTIDWRNTEDRIRREVEEEFIGEPVGETVKEAVRKLRIGQEKFRKRVLKLEKKCRVTGISDECLLIASHIKPWAECTSDERLDENNGLMLAPHVDRLFDLGLISFSDDGRILADPPTRRILLKWGIDPNIQVGKFSEEQMRYLRFHRKRVLSIQ